MNRVTPLRAMTASMIAAILIVPSPLSAQQDRAPHQSALRAWRAADPALEKDAATTGPTVADRVQKVAPVAANYAAARKQYFESALEQADRRAAASTPIAILVDSPGPKQMLDSFVASQSKSLTAGLTAIGDDPDTGLVLLRQAMERERAALASLTDGIKSRQAAAEAAAKASANANQAQEKSNEAFRTLAKSFAQSVQAAADLQAGFADYYRMLIDGSRAAALRDPSPAPVVVTSAAPALRGANTASPAANAPPVSLSRYLGAWAYSAASPMFHGREPEFVEVAVREDNGRVNGSFYVQFKASGGVAGDRIVRFDFSGPAQNMRNQSFPLETPEGLKGTVELIPGPAFNLLEVTFQIDPKPGKITEGNFILMKK